MFGRNGKLPLPNPLLLVAIAAIAGAAQPVLGPLWLGILLSAGFGLYGGLALREGYRAIGALFIVAALLIVVTLVVRGGS